jgi:hypothetical protein
VHMGVAFFVYHGISRVSLHICAFHTQRGPCRLGVANNTEGTAKYFEQTGLVVYVLVPSYPIAAVGTGVAGRAREWASDLIQQAAPPFPRFPPARVAPPPPHTRGRGGTPWGSSASQSPVEFRPWLGAGSGRVPGPEFAAGTAAGAACRISGSLGGPEIR